MKKWANHAFIFAHSVYFYERYSRKGNFKAFIEVDFPHNEGENITFISKTNYTSGFYVSSNDLTDYLIGADVFKITLKYRACG